MGEFVFFRFRVLLPIGLLLLLLFVVEVMGLVRKIHDNQARVRCKLHAASRREVNLCHQETDTSLSV